MDYHTITIRITDKYNATKKKGGIKMKLFYSVLAVLGAAAATLGTQGCAILILDEPTSGLDPIMQNIFYDLLKEEKEKGNTIFYSTHILNEVSKICDRVGIIRNGELIKVVKIEEKPSCVQDFIVTNKKERCIILKSMRKFCLYHRNLYHPR